MSVTVKFFANLRESTGLSEVSIEYRPGMTIAGAWEAATGGKEPPARMLTAVNMNYQSRDIEIKDHDEVAFFPMVSGG